MKRGEIRWYTLRLPDKRRPVLVLTRNDVIDRLNEIIRCTGDANNLGIDDCGGLNAGRRHARRVRAEL